MKRRGLGALGVLLWLSLAACDARGPVPEPAPSRIEPAPSSESVASTSRASKGPPADDVSVRTRWPAADRIVAIGDVHGDFAATERVLAMAGLAKSGRWTGGKSVLVQVGDVLDRGDGERAILELLERLEAESHAVGGEVIAMNGNHELMNAAGDFRYVTDGGFAAFEGVADDVSTRSAMPESQRARAAAFAPGGSFARRLAKHPTIAIVGATLFVHGGLEPSWANDLEGTNRDVARWLAGLDSKGARVVAADDGPVWTRRYSDEPNDALCAEVRQTLEKVGVERMVVGHTVQRAGVTSACDERVWRVDVGLASYYGGKTEALEITKSGVRVLRE